MRTIKTPHIALGAGPSQYADITKEIPVIASMTPSRRTGINQYRQQQAETRTLLFQQLSLRMVSSVPEKDISARREFVLKRVTREFWTNFCIRGQESAMLHHLQSAIRAEFGEDIQFFYPPGDVQLVILHDGPFGPEEVSPQIQTSIVNRAWQLAQELVAAHMEI